jgi:hypothetical protein
VLYQSLTWLRDNNGSEALDLTFSVIEASLDKKEINLIPNGSKVSVNDRNKRKYIDLMISHLTEGKVGKQAELVRQGLEAVVSKEVLEIFNEREFSLMICGIPSFDVDDWKSNTNVASSGTDTIILDWYWKFLHSLSQEERGLLFRFCTGSSRLPPTGFSGLIPQFSISIVFYDKKKALPTAATCFNHLKLPRYE